MRQFDDIYLTFDWQHGVSGNYSELHLHPMYCKQGMNVSTTHATPSKSYKNFCRYQTEIEQSVNSVIYRKIKSLITVANTNKDTGSCSLQHIRTNYYKLHKHRNINIKQQTHKWQTTRTFWNCTVTISTA